ncbi:MAG TPA: class A beta-lactamase-related serine hydrolase [Terrimesophilobacter sp.]|nr:class A beta-lactamase-related serine hydrolase [Terrimesophilobacter sp.]HRP99760.1 class A beta-lactamase-related serine hydrolase [Terrimesophilobacter sp.]
MDRAPRHRGVSPTDKFTATFVALGELAIRGAKVSTSVSELRTGLSLVAIDDRIVLPTASVGKVLLLIEVAARIVEGASTELEILDKESVPPIADSGVWQFLQAPSLPIVDVAALVGASSDNLATNVLLQHLGLDSVRQRAESIGLGRTALLDMVRDERGPDDAPQLSVGSTAELAWLFGALARGQVVDAAVSQRVLDWLSLGTDLSLVASAFGLDPLAHRQVDHDIQVINKTGTDAGVRSEAGVLFGPRTAVAYAVTVQFSDDSLQARLAVLHAMRIIGHDLLEYVH